MVFKFAKVFNIRFTSASWLDELNKELIFDSLISRLFNMRNSAALILTKFSESFSKIKFISSLFSIPLFPNVELTIKPQYLTQGFSSTSASLI